MLYCQLCCNPVPILCGKAICCDYCGAAPLCEGNCWHHGQSSAPIKIGFVVLQQVFCHCKCFITHEFVAFLLVVDVLRCKIVIMEHNIGAILVYFCFGPTPPAVMVIRCCVKPYATSKPCPIDSIQMFSQLLGVYKGVGWVGRCRIHVCGV